MSAEPMIDLITVEARFGLSAAWLKRSAVRTHLRIPHYRIGHLLRFRASELAAWLATHTNTHPLNDGNTP